MLFCHASPDKHARFRRLGLPTQPAATFQNDVTAGLIAPRSLVSSGSRDARRVLNALGIADLNLPRRSKAASKAQETAM